VFICTHRQNDLHCKWNNFKTKKDYFLELNPDKTDASTHEIFRFCYHNVKEFRDYKRAFYRERYRQKINNNVRQYIKYQTNTTEQNSNENNFKNAKNANYSR